MDLKLYFGCMTVFSVLALLLNGVTMVGIVVSPTLRKVAHIFTFNIALADFVTSCVLLIQQWLQYWAVIDVWYLTPIFGASFNTSICTTLVVAFHRLIIIRLNPFNCSRFVTAPRCIAISVSLWLICMAINLGLSSRNGNLFHFIIQPILVISTIAVCGICYIVIYLTLNASARHVNLSSTAYLHRIKQNKRVLCTFALIVGSNMACWSMMCTSTLFVYFRPDIVLDPDATVDDGRPFKPWVETWVGVGFWLITINAVINPVIYWTRLSDFRRVAISCCGCRDDSTSDNSLTGGRQIDEEVGGTVNAQLSELPTVVSGVQNEGYKEDILSPV